VERRGVQHYVARACGLGAPPRYRHGLALGWNQPDQLFVQKPRATQLAVARDGRAVDPEGRAVEPVQIALSERGRSAVGAA